MVQSLVGELRSYKPHDVAKNKNKFFEKDLSVDATAIGAVVSIL